MGSMNLKVNEPSMEDILASIRRIISDEQEADQEPPYREPDPSPLKSVLDIAERHISSSFYPASDEERPLVQDDPFQEEPSIARLVESYEHERASAPAASAKAATQISNPPCERNPGESLMSRTTEDCVSEAFGRLNALRAPGQPQTVEDLMKEMLRPMLRAWLDQNLPALVERLVKAEIERVTRG